MSNRMTIAEHDAFIARSLEKMDAFYKEHPEQDRSKRKLICPASIFTPMGYDDYHRNGELCQERESFEEQSQRVARMVKQQR